MPDRDRLKPARVFLALWPEQAARDRLEEEGRRLRQSLRGRLTRPETIHLTLVFIGDLARARIQELLDGLSGVQAAAFRIDFDRAACWRHNRIAFLAPANCPEALRDLVKELEARLDTLAIAYDRRPYKPHVTLLRKAECPKENPAVGRVSDSPEWGDFKPIAWSAKHFVLVESVPTPDGVRYDVLGRFPLL